MFFVAAIVFALDSLGERADVCNVKLALALMCVLLLSLTIILSACATHEQRGMAATRRQIPSTKSPPSKTQTENGRWMDAEISFYCACKKCCGPNAQGITANGTRAVVGITCAAPRTIPFGTRIRIPSLGWRTVQDRSSPKFDHRIDVFVADHAEAIKLGIRNERVFIEEK